MSAEKLRRRAASAAWASDAAEWRRSRSCGLASSKYRAHASALPGKMLVGVAPAAAHRARSSLSGLSRSSRKRSQRACRSAFSTQPAKSILWLTSNAFKSLTRTPSPAWPSGLDKLLLEEGGVRPMPAAESLPSGDNFEAGIPARSTGVVSPPAAWPPDGGREFTDRGGDAKSGCGGVSRGVFDGAAVGAEAVEAPRPAATLDFFAGGGSCGS
mmetsp:Transcript_112734/g.318623  ORF Transcript_112734/g.318623 Transcript_112734/m.318623 type:complete len:213 (-) Transcript_112734:347-985(-)